MNTTTPGSYQSANLNANVNIGNTTNTFQPNFQAYCGSFSVGSLLIPTTTTSVYTAGPIGLNSPVGTFINGGGLRVQKVGGIGANVVIEGDVFLPGGNITLESNGLTYGRVETNFLRGSTAGGLVISDVQTINGSPWPPVTSLNAQTGAVTIGSRTGSVTVTNPLNGEINLEVSATGAVTSVNGASGAITVAGTAGVTAATVGQIVTLSAPGIATAQATADTALADAATAQGVADSALALATTADATANSALALATLADGTANSALALATTADATANSALTLAGTANTTANSALALATTADATANSALALATTADATANSALVLAGTADATANSALVLAGTANATAITALAQSGVTSVNSGTGGITVSAGTGISVGTSGSTITITNSSPGGGGVTSFNSLTGAIILAAGTNISLVPVGNTITVNQINIPVTNRASGTTPLLITATTFATAQTIGNLSLVTSAVFDINVWAVSVITTDQNAQRDMNLFITINGTQVGQVFTSTLNGVGHFLSMPNQCSLVGAAAGTQTILLKGYASVAGHLTVNSFQLSAIGNLA
jgi:hypothetical protein